MRPVELTRTKLSIAMSPSPQEMGDPQSRHHHSSNFCTTSMMSLGYGPRGTGVGEYSGLHCLQCLYRRVSRWPFPSALRQRPTRGNLDGPTT